MPDLLADPDRTLLLVLTVLAVVAVGVWWSTRRKGWIAAAAGLAATIVVLLITDRVSKSDREQIGDNLQSMAAAVGPRDLDAVFAHVSDSFRYGPTTDKKAFRQFCEAASRSFSVRELVIWDVRVLNVGESADRAEVSFRFKVKAGGNAGFAQEGFYMCKSVFVQDPDGAWRLQGFQVYPPTGFDPPVYVPGLG